MKNKKLTMRIMAGALAAMMLFAAVAGVLAYILH